MRKIKKTSLKLVKKTPLEVKEILESNKIIKFLLDTNVILAYLNSTAQFHLEAKTSIDGLIVEQIWFIIPHLVMGEFINHRNLLGKGSVSINSALKSFDKIKKNLNKILLGGTSIDMDTVIHRYKMHGRHKKLTTSGFADFMILTEAEEITNVRILTCDKKMAKCGKTIFKNKIYYLPNKTKEMKSDYPRLMAEIQNQFKTKS